MPNFSIPKTVNPDLAVERKNASFNSEEFAIWFYGSKQAVDIRRLIDKEMYRDFDDSSSHEYLSYEDLVTLSIKQAINGARKFRDLQNCINPGGSEFYPALMNGSADLNVAPSGYPFVLHVVLFTHAIKSQGTPEQYEMFGRRAENLEIIGTYAQTELGHGTYLRGLETRADYDRNTQEFILNTPTLTSYKWWPGGLGHTCNYCIVVAQLFIDGVNKGIQMFMVQIRDEETHMPLPGVHVGDIGKKISINGVNNGFLGLKNVRVPRLNMLMKNQQVLADGTFIESPVSTLSYFSMVYARCWVAVYTSTKLAIAATIATRYSVVRRQSPIEESQPESKILEHLTQQMKILPEISNAIAYRLACNTLLRLYDETSEAIGRRDFSRLAELHGLACILKVSCSYDSTFGVERLRQSCGGHGYLAAANLGNLFAETAASCTYEGENSVLLLQVGKILMKVWSDVLASKQLMPTFSYLADLAQWERFPQWDGSWNCLVKAFKYASLGATRIAFRHCSERLLQGQSQNMTVNNSGLGLIKAAELHGHAFVADSFYEEVVNGKNRHERSVEFQKVLENLLELHLLNTFFRQLGDILRFISLTDHELEVLQTRLESVLNKLRPDAVAIVDGFDFHDRLLSSVLGSYDGNVYERLFDSTLKNPLNAKPVPNFYDLHLKPFIKENALTANKSKL